MKKVLRIVMALFAVTAISSGQRIIEAGRARAGSLQDYSAAQFIPPTVTVAQLPAAAVRTGRTYIVSNGVSASDCSVGGGTTAVWCRSNGVSYSSLGGGGVGSGTVTDLSFTGGLISVATSTTTPALTVAGTSGGVPYFSSASTWASSAALTANLPVIGGGAGAAPSVGTRSGNTTAFVTTTGTQTSGRCVEIDASGNHIAGAAVCGTGTGTMTVVGAGALASTALMTGGGTTTAQTPSATSTLDGSGNMALAGTLAATGVSTGTSPPTCTVGTAGAVCLKEGTAPTGEASVGIFYTKTDHLFYTKLNNGSEVQIPTASSVATWTNKTFDTAGSGNAFAINGTSITAVSGTGAVCLASGSACTGGGGSGTPSIQLSLGGSAVLGAGTLPAWIVSTGTTAGGSGNYVTYQISGLGSNVVLVRQFAFPSDWVFASGTRLKVWVGDGGFAGGNIKLDVQLSCEPTNYTNPTYNTAVSSGSFSMMSVGTQSTPVTIAALDVTGCSAGNYASIKVTYDVSVASHSTGFDILNAILQNN